MASKLQAVSYPTVLLILFFPLIVPKILIQNHKLLKKKWLEKKWHGRQSRTKHYTCTHAHTRSQKHTHTSGFSFRCLSLYIFLRPSSHTIVFLSLLNVAQRDHSHHVQIGSQHVITLIKPFSTERVAHFIRCLPFPYIGHVKSFRCSLWKERRKIKSSRGISQKAMTINHVEFCVMVACSWFLYRGDSVLTMT